MNIVLIKSWFKFSVLSVFLALITSFILFHFEELRNSQQLLSNDYYFLSFCSLAKYVNSNYLIEYVPILFLIYMIIIFLIRRVIIKIK
jgi:hypothetical protein